MNQVSPARVLIVTGMHRSGTSLTASCFANGGVSMGEQLLPADSANRRGYYEDNSFLELQRQMLKSALPPAAPGWPDWGWAEGEALNREAFEAYYTEAAELAAERSSKHRVWGWKDPRTSLLLEFWERIVPEANFVFVFREPWDVQDSIQRLKAPVFEKNPRYALKIWRDYNLALLKFVKERRDRCVLAPLQMVLSASADFVGYTAQKFALPLSPAKGLEELFEPGMLRRKKVDPRFLREFAATNGSEWRVWLELNEFADRSPDGCANPAQTSVDAVYAVPEAPVWSTSPRVSIIVTCYNLGLYLLDALDSAAACDPALCEVIIVDDGSTDSQTREIINRIQERGWRVICQDRSGLANTRNTGIRAAAGDFILPLDADNRIAPDYVVRGIQVLDAEPSVGVLYGDCEFFGERQGRQSPADFDLQLLHLGNYIDACAVFRKELWEQVGGFDARMPAMGFEDWDLWLSAAERGWEFRHAPEVLFYYRVRSNSMLKENSNPESYRATVEYLAQKHSSFRTDYHRVIAGLNEVLLKTREQAHEAESYARSLARTLQMRHVELSRADQEVKLQRERAERAESYARSLEATLKARESELTSSQAALDLGRQQFLEAERYAKSLEQHLKIRQKELETALARVEAGRQQFREAELYAQSLKEHLDARQQEVHAAQPDSSERRFTASEDDAEDFGQGLKPGDEHYRAYVGPPEEYDLIAAMTFNLLTTVGLREDHRVIDIGCGSLRIGRLLIPFLKPGRYVGIEPHEWLVQEGIRREIGAEQVRLKRPRFFFVDNLSNMPRDMRFDLAVAQSVFSHGTLDLIVGWLEGLHPRLEPNGILLATFKQGETDSSHPDGVNPEDFLAPGWVYPKCLSYRVETIERLAKRCGFAFQLLDWRHPRQTWALFSREQFSPWWGPSCSLSWNNYLASRFHKEQ